MLEVTITLLWYSVNDKQTTIGLRDRQTDRWTDGQTMKQPTFIYKVF